MEHSPVSATGIAWERTPWHAMQRAVWGGVERSEADSVGSGHGTACVRRDPRGRGWDDVRRREALAAAGVHRPTQAGISGSTAEGADSIVVSGGYEDDRDFGDEIV